jgi:hypothetical protein
MNSPQTVSDPIRRMPRPVEVARMTTAELRAAFLVPALYVSGRKRA